VLLKVWFKNWSSNNKLRETYFQKRGENPDSALTANAEAEVRALVAEYPDATLVELSELLLQQTGNWVSRTALCRYLQKLGLNRKKKHGTVAKLEQKEYKS
jgi:transposase